MTDTMTPTPEDVLRALLLFHSSGPWDREKSVEWERLTGSQEATTKVLCGLARQALERAP